MKYERHPLTRAILLFSFVIIPFSAHAGPSTTPSIGLFASGQSLFDDDMERTYGAIPGFGLQLQLPYTSVAQFVAGVQYTGDDGDPLYDLDGMHGSAALHLTSLEFGLRRNVMPDQRHRFFVGAAAQYVHVSERVDGGQWEGDHDAATAQGWGFAGRLMLGPEWRLARDRMGAGFEFSLELGTIYAKWDHHEREVPLSGFQGRGYLCVDM